MIWEDFMGELKIIGWTDFECEYPTPKLSREDLGTVISLIHSELSENNYVFSGEEHQNAPTGVPVFSDGTCFRASMRAWGHLMSRIYSGPNGEELSYMDFYTSLGDASIMPEYSEIDVEPAKVETESSGCTMKADREFVDQSRALGFAAMTTDKVIQKLLDE